MPTIKLFYSQLDGSEDPDDYLEDIKFTVKHNSEQTAEKVDWDCYIYF